MTPGSYLAALLKGRRERRRLLALGYRPHKTDPEILRGHHRDEVIIDAVISADGKYVYTKIGNRSEALGKSAAADARNRYSLDDSQAKDAR